MSMDTNRDDEVFVVLTGVSGNLGDAVIRRRVLEWSRPFGRVHAYVGRTTAGWVEELQIRPDEVVYGAAERRVWLRRLLLGRGRRLLMLDPGEVPLGREHLKSEVMFLVITALLRLRGGHIFRPPRAVGGYDSLTGWFYRVSARLSQTVLWRDRPSLERMRVGELTPDTAFAEPATEGTPFESRDRLLITLRGKRPFPTAATLAAVATFAEARGLRIVTMAQVDEDEARCAEVAAELGSDVAEYIPWADRSDLAQENAIRGLYEDCAYVLSDRLHVLILAAKAGAVPIEVAPTPAAKVRTHFATIDYEGLSLDAEGASTLTVVEFLQGQVGRHEEVVTKLAHAHDRLTSRVQRALASR